MASVVAAYVVIALAAAAVLMASRWLALAVLGDKLELTLEDADGKRKAVLLRGDAATLARHAVRMLQGKIEVLRAELAQERGE